MQKVVKFVLVVFLPVIVSVVPGLLLVWAGFIAGIDNQKLMMGIPVPKGPNFLFITLAVSGILGVFGCGFWAGRSSKK